MGKDGDASDGTAKVEALDDIKKLESSMSSHMICLDSSITDQMQELCDITK